MSQNQSSEDTIDLKELFFSLIAQWKLIALCVILSLICALLYLRITPETYAVNALVQVEESKGTSAALLGDLANMVDQKQPAQAEIEILKSRMVLGKVIDELNLNIQVGALNNGVFNRIISPENAVITYDHTGVIYQDQNKKLDIRQFEVPTQYQDKALTLKFEGQQYQIIDPILQQVVFQAPINQMSQSKAATTDAWKVGIFTQDQFDEPFSITHQSLPAAVNSIMTNLSVAEKGKLTGIIGLNYQGENKAHLVKVLNAILSAYSQQNVERRSAETAQTLQFLNEQLPELRQQLDTAEREFNVFRQQYNTVDVNQESQLYLNKSVTLETQKAEIEQKRAEAASKYTSAHPTIQEFDAQLASVNQEIESLNSTLKQLPDLQRRYLQLYREVEVKTQLYTSLLNSSQQLKIAKAGEIGNVRIIDTAVEPIKPIKPKKLMILVLSLFVGGFIGVLIALLRNMMRSGIKDASQLENELNLPVYATVPRSPVQESRIKLLKKHKATPILAVKNSDDVAIESLRSMRTAIHFALSSAKNNIIMLSGPAPEVGKSFVSANLATILAGNQKRVLLIDGDMRRGYLHLYFNRTHENGLADYLAETDTLSNVIHSTEVEGLDFIACGKNPTHPSELLSLDRFKEMLDTLSPLYDHIIIDTPPVLAVTDGIIVSQYAGVNILLARFAKTSMKELEIAISRFEQAGVKVDGLILNDVQRGGGYGYGYNYTYAYSAKKGLD